MKEILGQAKNIRTLLGGKKFAIDYYQREYRWAAKQVNELLDDLTEKFFESHEDTNERSDVEKYGHYFLGSIIISDKDGHKFIIDGQQRLTSLTLILIYLYRHLNEDDQKKEIANLIFSYKHGARSFNLDVDERRECMESLFSGESFEINGQPESVVNIIRRYQDIEESFPDELREDALPYFADWLIENVHLVEITAYSDSDAYTIFETMNDRGLSLTPPDMLKGYLLANIKDQHKRTAANDLWRKRLLAFNDIGKEVESDFFKTWLRSRYATKIRERRKGATPEDFDRIGTEFHRWLREESEAIGLNKSDDYYQFIEREFDFYSRRYMQLVKAAMGFVKGLEHVRYNAELGFTQQYLLLLAPLKPGDSDDVINLKHRIVGRYLDILLNWRLWNFRSISYSTMQYSIFTTMREIRGLDPQPLASELYQRLQNENETFSKNSPYHRPGINFRMHQQNRRAVHRILARITDYVQTQSGMPSGYLDFVKESRNRFEVEHIWANQYEDHRDEFDHPVDFDEYRNKIGGLLLLPKSFNASFGDMPYEAKLEHYNSQNLLARSLHPQCYVRNPGFLQFVERSGLPFRPHETFKKADLEIRGELYRMIAERVWNPEDLLREVAG